MSTTIYTYAQVAAHNTEDDCWIVLFDKVYDMTRFMRKGHSGGFAPLGLAGRDATTMFCLIHPASVFQILDSEDFDANYRVGLVEAPRISREDYETKPYKEIKETAERLVGKPRDAPAHHALAILGLLASAALYAAFVAANSLPWTAAIAAAIFSAASPIVHMGNHGGITKNRRLADAYVTAASMFLGLSPSKWRNKHYGHHNDTMGELDDDTRNIYPLARLDESRPVLWHHKYQHIYFPICCFPLLHVNYLREDVLFTLQGKFQTRTERITYVLILCVFLALFLAVPCALHGWARGLLLFAVFSMSISLAACANFTTNHLAEETQFNDPDKQRDIARSQIEGSHNVCSRGPLAPVFNLLTGGLSLQIEHHLFPSYHYLLYPKLRDQVVRPAAERHGLQYTSTDSGWTGGFLDSQLEFLRRVKTLGCDRTKK